MNHDQRAAQRLPAPKAGVTASAQQVARDAFDRVLGKAAGNVLVDIAPMSEDGFVVSATEGLPHITASSPATALMGLRSVLAKTGEPFDEILSAVSGIGPIAPEAPIVARARLQHRFYGNDTEDSYVGAYRTFEDWERLIDGLVARGFNEIFVPVGIEGAYVDLLTRFGYSRDEALDWIPLPSHQPWWLLQNMSSYPGGMSEELLAKRVQLGRRIIARLRELGVEPVVPGFGGVVPRDFGTPDDAFVDVPGNDWQGFDRPAWLDPRSTLFTEAASVFYDAVDRLLGPVDMFKIDPLHEGGTTTIDIAEAGRGIERAMQRARPGATWVLLAWQDNPRRELLDALDPRRVLVVDGVSDRHLALDREEDFRGVDYAFGAIWNFGGDTALGAQLATWNDRVEEWLKVPSSRLRGIAALPEGGLNNPLAMDFFASLAWRDGRVDVDDWVRQWTIARYGRAVPAAVSAWQRIVATAYSLPDDNDFSEPHDSLFAAWPSFSASTSSLFSPRTATYDLSAFAEALPLMSDAADDLGRHRAFRFDLADVARQTVTNTARQLLPAIADAYGACDGVRYDELTRMWIQGMELLDAIAGTEPLWLLGRFLDEARAAGSDPEERDRLERSQRLILSTWGPLVPATTGALSNYAGRDWQGLIGTLYLPRWREFFTGNHPDRPRAREITDADWWHRDQDWVDSTDRAGIRSEPSGDIVALSGLASVFIERVQGALSQRVAG